jgi:hypothetical protein
VRAGFDAFCTNGALTEYLLLIIQKQTNEKNTTSQLKSMNTNIAMTYRDGNASPGL